LNDGEFHDEDIEVEVEDGVATNQYEQVLTGDAEIPVLYRSGNPGYWTEQAASTLPYINAGDNTNLQYNSVAASTWGQTAVSNTKFVSYFLIATNDWQYPVKMIQGNAEYATKTAARDGVSTEIGAWGPLPAAEWILVYQFIMQTGVYAGVKNAQIVEVNDFRTAEITGASALATDHGILTGLGDDDHTQYALLAGRSGGQQLLGSTVTAEDLTLTDNSVDNNSITVTQAITAYTHSQVTHDYSYITGNDGATNVTAAELEELSDGSETTLHSHAGGGDHGSLTGLADDDHTQYLLADGSRACTGILEALTFNATDEDNVLQIDGATFFRTGAAANRNVFIGEETFKDDEGQNNVGIGYRAGYLNDTTGAGVEGDFNVYIGSLSGGGTVGGTNTGNYNVAIGYQSLLKNSTGYMNFALGRSALTDNTTGWRNVAVGVTCLERNTTGIANMALGYHAGRMNQTGHYNVILGYQAGLGNVGNSYSNNVFIGRDSALNITTGSNNVIIGYKSGNSITNESNRLIIDNQIRGSAAAEITDCLIYGVFDATVTSQTLRFNVGNFSVASGTPYQYLINNTHEDSDGGRESRIDFKGEQSGGEETTLARIQVQHDGASDDQKGEILFYTNDGSDSDTPTQRMKIDSAGQFSFEGTMMIKEQAAANADVAAYGQIWVKTATPNELWFTDDAGTDVQLGAGGSAPTGDLPTNLDSDANTMLKSHAYLTQTAGTLTARPASDTSSACLIYVDDTDDPAGAGDLVARQEMPGGGATNTCTAFIGSGVYFEVIQGTVAATIWWTPLVNGGGAPIDQD